MPLASLRSWAELDAPAVTLLLLPNHIQLQAAVAAVLSAFPFLADMVLNGGGAGTADVYLPHPPPPESHAADAKSLRPPSARSMRSMRSMRSSRPSSATSSRYARSRAVSRAASPEEDVGPPEAAGTGLQRVPSKLTMGNMSEHNQKMMAAAATPHRRAVSRRSRLASIDEESSETGLGADLAPMAQLRTASAMSRGRRNSRASLSGFAMHNAARTSTLGRVSPSKRSVAGGRSSVLSVDAAQAAAQQQKARAEPSWMPSSGDKQLFPPGTRLGWPLDVDMNGFQVSLIIHGDGYARRPEGRPPAVNDPPNWTEIMPHPFIMPLYFMAGPHIHIFPERHNFIPLAEWREEFNRPLERTSAFLFVTWQIAAAVAHMHTQWQEGESELLHLDLCPENVFACDDIENDEVAGMPHWQRVVIQLTDLRCITSAGPPRKPIGGRPGFWAPEQMPPESEFWGGEEDSEPWFDEDFNGDDGNETDADEWASVGEQDVEKLFADADGNSSRASTPHKRRGRSNTTNSLWGDLERFTSYGPEDGSINPDQPTPSEDLLSTRTDVWAVGMILIFLVDGGYAMRRLGFFAFTNLLLTARWVDQDGRTVPSAAQQLIVECLNLTPADRPPMGDVVDTLADIIKDMTGWQPQVPVLATDDMVAEKLERQKVCMSLLGPASPYTNLASQDLADTYEELAMYAEAEELYRSLLIIERDRYGPEHMAVLSVSIDLAQCLEARGKFQEEVELLGNIIAMQSKFFGKSDGSVVSSMAALANALRRVNRIPDAIELYREILEIELETLGDHHAQTRATMSKLALSLMADGRHNEANRTHRQLLAVQRRDLGVDHPETQDTLRKVAINNTTAGRLDTSVDDSATFFSSIAARARALHLQGDWEQAEKLYRGIVAVRSRTLGKMNPDTLVVELYLSSVLIDACCLQDADELLNRVVEGLLFAHGPDNIMVHEARHQLARLRLAQGRIGIAARTLDELASCIEETDEGDSDNVLFLAVQTDRAVAFAAEGHYTSASNIHNDVLPLRKRLLGYKHPETLRSRFFLATCQAGLGHRKEAFDALHEVLSMQQKSIGNKHHDTLVTKLFLARIAAEDARYTKAEGALVDNLVVLQKTIGVEHATTLECFALLGYVTYRLGKLSKAKSLLEKSAKAHEQIFGLHCPATVRANIHLALVLAKMGSMTRARAAAVQAVESATTHCDDVLPLVLEAKVALASVLCDMDQTVEATALAKDIIDTVARKRFTVYVMQAHAILARAFLNNGEYARAEAEAKLAHEGLVSVFVPGHPDTLAARAVMAHVSVAMGKYPRGEEHHREVQRSMESIQGEEHPDAILASSYVADTLGMQGFYTDCLSISRQASSQLSSMLGRNEWHSLRARYVVGRAQFYLGRFADAERTLRDVLDAAVLAYGASGLFVLTVTADLAHVMLRMGKRKECDDMVRKAQADGAAKRQHPVMLLIRRAQAVIQGLNGRYVLAEREFHLIHKAQVKQLGSDHPHSLATMYALSRTYYEQGQAEVIRIRGNVLGDTAESIRAKRNTLALTKFTDERYHLAERVLRDVLDRRSVCLGPEHPDTLAAKSDLGEILFSLSEFKAAETICREVADVQKRTIGMHHPDFLTTQGRLARVVPDVISSMVVPIEDD